MNKIKYQSAWKIVCWWPIGFWDIGMYRNITPNTQISIWIGPFEIRRQLLEPDGGWRITPWPTRFDSFQEYLAWKQIKSAGSGTEKSFPACKTCGCIIAPYVSEQAGAESSYYCFKCNTKHEPPEATAPSSSPPPVSEAPPSAVPGSPPASGEQSSSPVPTA